MVTVMACMAAVADVVGVDNCSLKSCVVPERTNGAKVMALVDNVSSYTASSGVDASAFMVN